MASEFALVGAPEMKKKPYWYQQAQNLADNYPAFSRPLIADWQRVVSESKSNGIRKANQRLDSVIKQFKFGNFRIDQCDNDQLVNDYAKAKAEACIKLLQDWMLGNGLMPASAKKVIPILEYHGLETKALKDIEQLSALAADYSRLEKSISKNEIDLERWLIRASGFKWSAGAARIKTRHMTLALDDQREEQNKITEKLVNIKRDCRALLMRVQDQAWWRRKIRSVSGRRIEAISRELGWVNKSHSIYCSGFGRQEYKRRKQLNLNMMEYTVLENDDGEQYTLADLAALSNSNPAIRKTELMVRLAGFDIYAREQGYEGYAITLTCPSKYHAHNQGGYNRVYRNPKFAGYTQRDAQDYLCNLWAKFRAKASRNEWRFFGFRVAEPHHDGTPHWHLALHIHQDDADDLLKAFREKAFEEDGKEAGAYKHRFVVEKIKTGINPNTGKEYSLAGYMAKYISKNVDGEHIDEDEYGTEGSKAAESVVVWASRNGIRQFQQIGGPKVSGWRELRRLARQTPEEIAELPALVKVAVSEVERLTQESAATAWAWYCRYCGENGKISLWRIIRTAEKVVTAIEEHIDESTGEILQHEYSHAESKIIMNAYGEPVEKDHGIKAILAGSEIYIQTRFMTWKRVPNLSREATEEVRERRKAERASRAAAAELRRAERAAKGATAPPRTGVNNCTVEIPPEIPDLTKDLFQMA